MSEEKRRCKKCGAKDIDWCICNKEYILKKDCPNIGKEIGDYYNNEYEESIEELITKGIIKEETQPIE